MIARNCTKSNTSTAIPSSFDTYLNASFKSSDCADGKDDLLRSKFGAFYADKVFDSVTVDIILVKRDTCQYDCTIKFGPKLQMYNISEVFEDNLKSLNYTVDTLKLTDIKTEVYVSGVTLEDFKAGADDCRKKCCGAGGPITVYRTCSPSYKCKSHKLKKVEPDCMNVCSDVCSGVICKISLLVLLFGVFMNWFLK